MSDNSIPLNTLPIGCKAHVLGLRSDSPLKRRLLDLGLTQDTVVEAVQKSPGGDPTAYLIRGAVIALRSEDAACVFLSR